MSKTNPDVRVTVVIVPRESFNDYAKVVERIYANTRLAFNMIVMEGNAPEPVRGQLRKLEKQHKSMKIVYSEKWLLSSEAVNLARPMVDTEYVCFIDNDVEVMPEAIDLLVKCADEEKAGCVHPIYLTTTIEDPEQRIHVAEGKLIRKPYKGKMYIDSIMTFSGIPLKEYPDPRRKPSDFFEWHCVLFRKSMMDKIGPLERLNIAEHIDYSLEIEKAGDRIILEPKSVVAYEYDRIWRLRGKDRDYFLFRWDNELAGTSLDRLIEKWGLVYESTLRRRHWVSEHTGKVKTTFFVRKSINKIRRLLGLENLPYTSIPKPVLPKEIYS